MTTSSLDGLLGILERKASEGYYNSSYRGKALSTDGQDLHLAVEQGILSIPISEITWVEQVGEHPDNVWIDVKSSDKVKLLRRADQHSEAAHADVQEGTGTNECDEGTETSSHSHGEADACDDFHVHCWRD